MPFRTILKFCYHSNKIQEIFFLLLWLSYKLINNVSSFCDGIWPNVICMAINATYSPRQPNSTYQCSWLTFITLGLQLNLYSIRDSTWTHIQLNLKLCCEVFICSCIWKIFHINEQYAECSERWMFQKKSYKFPSSMWLIHLILLQSWECSP